MKFSVITVNLNNANGLLKTIESVVNQKYTDFEFIIIDGGSTDGSKEIIESNEGKITHWASEKDNGIYHAMNKGIRIAKGEYLLFLNSGDFLVDEYVLRKVFENKPDTDIIIGDCRVSQNGEIKFIAIPPDEISLAAFIGRAIPHQSAFIRHDLFERLGYYSEQYKILSDLDFFLKALVVNNCSYYHMPLLISDYNLEGVSNETSQKTFSHNEREMILNQLILPRILKDYSEWGLKKKEMEVLYWAKSKLLIYRPLTWIFKAISSISNHKKNPNLTSL